MSDGQVYKALQYRAQEERDLKRYVEELVPAMFEGCFVSSGATHEGCVVDVISLNQIGQVFLTELKGRSEKYSADTVTTLLIEKEKYERYEKLYKEKRWVPMYVNCFNNSSVFYIHYLPQVFGHRCEISEKWMKIGYLERNDETLEWEYKEKWGWRLFLPKKWAWRVDVATGEVTPPENDEEIRAKGGHVFDCFNGMGLEDIK